MTSTPTLFKVLLTAQHRQKFETFRAEYERAAREIGPSLISTAPSKAQFYRWLSGQLKGGTPYPDACRVLERMFPEWSAAELFAPCPPDHRPTPMTQPDTATSWHPRPEHADVVGVYPSRGELAAKVPIATLLDRASDIRAAGLSLNMICQQHPDQKLRDRIEAGTTLRCLFLDPNGDAIKSREREEGHPPGLLSTLTGLNMSMLTDRVRTRLSPAARDRLHVAVYDETVRFNILLVDHHTGVIQPYLPGVRGVDSPTFVVERQPDADGGLYPVFAQVFDALWDRSTPV